MKKNLFSRVICFALALIMVLALAACGNGDKETSKAPAETTKAPAETNGNEETKGTEAPEQTTEVEREEVDLIMYTQGGVKPGLNETIETVQEYLKEKLNVNLDLHISSDFSKVMGTKIDAGDDWDICLVGLGVNFQSYAQRNAFAPLNDYVDLMSGTTGQLIEGALDSFAIDGKIYAVPVLKDMFDRQGWTINTSMLDDLGVKFPEKYATNWDVVDFLYEVKAARDKKYPDKATNPIIKDVMYNYDQWYTAETLIGGWNKPLAAVNISEDYGYEGIQLNDTVFCPIYTDEYREVMKQVRQMVKDGIGAFDAKSFDPDKVLFQAGDLLGSCGSGLIHVDEDANMPYYKSAFYPSSINFAADYSFGFAVNAECENVDRAVEVIEMIQNDTYLATTLHFGKEGSGWTDADNDGVIELTEKNSDPKNRWQYEWYGWSLGGVTALKPIPGSPSNLMEQMKELNKTAEAKPNRGFKFDQTNVETEMAAINNVFAEYHAVLQSGQNDNVDELVDEFIAKLKANGMDKVLAECQSQLDAWRAANGK